ncbi:MAG: TolC family protein [Verrucomicrobiales bacterium]
MSTRHRWLAVYLAVTVAFPCSPHNAQAGSRDSDQPSGEVGLRELIDLALKTDPTLVALRLNIPVAEAEKRAVVQWRDPEIRLAYDTDDNIQLEPAFERSGRTTETINSGSGSQGTGGRNGDASGSSSSSQTRTTTFREKVIPGVDSDRIIRTETERRSTNSSSSSTDDRGTFDEEESETETIRSRSDSTRYTSRDRLARDESMVAKIRFWIPKPWEMKALERQAAKEVELANYAIIAAEREVILRVREDYEKLQYLYKRLRSLSSRIRVIEEHVAKENALLGAGGEFTLDQLSFEDIQIPGIKLAIDSAQVELQAAKRELAASVGLSDGSRIRVTDPLLRSTIDLQATDLDYLTRMAYAHRGEIGVLTHERSIAESELDVVKTRSIPWLSFIEAGVGRDTNGGDHTNDNYGVQLGVVLPLFSWLAKDEEVVQARIESYYGSIEASKKNIANQVAEAFRSVKEAGRHRTRVQDAVISYSKKNAEKAKKLDASDDLAAKEELRYEVESERVKFYDYVIQADRLYNQSLIRLEKALGADLDQVFNMKFEPLADLASPGEVLAAAAESARLTAPRARPVPQKIELESQKKQLGDRPIASRPKGLFNQGRKSQPDGNDPPKKKSGKIKKFSNR